MKILCLIRNRKSLRFCLVDFPFPLLDLHHLQLLSVYHVPVLLRQSLGP